MNRGGSSEVKHGTVIRARLHRISPGLGAALALLTFISPLLGTFHEAAVRHVACPEHGELIDAPDEAPHPHARASTGSPALFAESDPAGPSNSGEEHCAIALAAQVRAHQQPQSLSIDITPGAAVAPQPHREAPRPFSLAVYRLAPKASPPPA